MSECDCESESYTLPATDAEINAETNDVEVFVAYTQPETEVASVEKVAAVEQVAAYEPETQVESVEQSFGFELDTNVASNEPCPEGTVAEGETGVEGETEIIDAELPEDNPADEAAFPTDIVVNDAGYVVDGTEDSALLSVEGTGKSTNTGFYFGEEEGSAAFSQSSATSLSITFAVLVGVLALF
jgi:hypothetical protein